MRASTTMPPLQALRAFEAVGRLLSFRRAGEELLITQSAVSHHIKQLEETLGVRLFVRKAKSIELTPAGSAYLDKTVEAFGIIADATSEMRRQVARQRVRVSVLPSFAANWLVSRLAGFMLKHPEIEVELDPTLRLADFAADGVDLAIRFGSGQSEGIRAEWLMNEELSPVVSLTLYGDGSRFGEPGDLLLQTLLESWNPVGWELWLGEVGIDIRRARVLQLTDYNIVLQAALNGQGVAIGRMHMVRDHLAAGRLIQPFPQTVRSEKIAYWLVMPQDRRLSAGAETFASWLKEEAASPHLRVC
ncbi:transcriptional regulator, LysR family (plasmid) [Sinorhizobium fredii NGR234]|uniref:Transcriptional regulator, LysR family n=1 Tax=Sinorhizobium fredii (strain NBRC 101917 / NGR234) TaxID=394 RepID=C3KRQ9_SINFN|nr:transcriptional regulator GcvA [Sinorhizobium fredii]ACP22767.1 transcriptional regulator, LysR family [Sinorhizobium fredii NGR234]